MSSICPTTKMREPQNQPLFSKNNSQHFKGSDLMIWGSMGAKFIIFLSKFTHTHESNFIHLVEKFQKHDFNKPSIWLWVITYSNIAEEVTRVGWLVHWWLNCSALVGCFGFGHVHSILEVYFFWRSSQRKKLTKLC
jgi:hypothetical protein